MGLDQIQAFRLSNNPNDPGGPPVLANLVHVPGTGASFTTFVYNVKPGGYYLDVSSACAWQIALSPNGSV